MATVIIRPTSEPTSVTGFDVNGTTFIARINDNDTGTAATQNSTTCEVVGIPFDDSSSYSGATINSVTVSLTGNISRSASTVTTTLMNGNNQLQVAELTFSGASTQSASAYTSSLTPTIVDALTLNLNPDSAGITLQEVFITVDYTAAAGYSHKVAGIAASSVAKVSTLATASIGKINTVD